MSAMQRYEHPRGQWTRRVVAGQSNGGSRASQSNSDVNTSTNDKWSRIGLLRGVQGPGRSLSARSLRLQPYGSRPDSAAPTSKTVSIEDLEDELNCAIWMINLPMRTTAAWVVSRIRTGAIFSIHINEPARNDHLYAAKIVFMEHVGARKLLDHLGTREGMLEFGGLVRASYNRHGFVDSDKKGWSRVIRIAGRAPYMTETFWKAYLDGMVVIYGTKFHYQLTHCGQVTLPDGRLEVELGFASVTSQAYFVRQTILEDPCFQDLVDVVWMEDPCGC